MQVTNFVLRTAVRSRWKSPLVALLVAAASVASERASACDICAIYTATEMRESRIGPSAGVAEQFSRFTTLQQSGDEVANPAGERLESSITQVLLGYTLTPRLALQLNLPVVWRSFRRLEGGSTVSGHESGIGARALVGPLAPWSHVTAESVFRATLLGGVKFPTGDSNRLGEETGHDGGSGTLGGSGVTMDGMTETESPSGVHPHDLALGSGSFDGIVGGRIFGSWRRGFVTALLQYSVRTEGDFDYRYANDLTWSGGPGLFLLLEHDYTLGLQGLLTGETKSKDELNGMTLDDTAITALYAGPGMLFTWGSSLGAELAADLPVILNNSALQIVPDYRVRSGVVWRF